MNRKGRTTMLIGLFGLMILTAMHLSLAAMASATHPIATAFILLFSVIGIVMSFTPIFRRIFNPKILDQKKPARIQREARRSLEDLLPDPPVEISGLHTTYVGPSFDGDDPTAPPCDICGTITQRQGSCYKCLNCGATIGCD